MRKGKWSLSQKYPTKLILDLLPTTPSQKESWKSNIKARFGGLMSFQAGFQEASRSVFTFPLGSDVPHLPICPNPTQLSPTLLSNQIWEWKWWKSDEGLRVYACSEWMDLILIAQWTHVHHRSKLCPFNSEWIPGSKDEDWRLEGVDVGWFLRVPCYVLKPGSERLSDGIKIQGNYSFANKCGN